LEPATVLIVDDEPRVLDALEAVLAAEFRVLRADGGEEALRALQAHDVAVIVTDHRMPGMTGIELLRRSQELAPGPSASSSRPTRTWTA
jgi:CheY-like chemotaxis protein